MRHNVPSVLDVPSPQPRRSPAVKLLLLFIFVCLGLMPVILMVGFRVVEAADRLSGRSGHLEQAISVPSPDGKLRFTASLDGHLNLIDVRTGLSLQAKHISTSEYRLVEAKWPDNRHINILARYRYPLQKDGDYFSWSGSKWNEEPYYGDKF